ncbi:sigma-70 family RNA polymerase sigma factor [Deltaproteobacteria bacterium TL4]
MAKLMKVAVPPSKEQQTLPDQLIVKDILSGNIQQFEVLITRYRNNIYRFILKHVDEPALAEDLSQDTFIAAYQQLASFQGNSTFLTWLFGIALNKVRNHLNRSPEKRYHFVSEELVANISSQEQTPLEVMENKNSLIALKRALNQLSPDLKEVAILVCLEGFSYEETAGIMEIPAGTVRSKLYRAREMLRQLLHSSKE